MDDAPPSPELGQPPTHRRHRKRRTHKNWKASRLVHAGIIVLALAIGAVILVVLLRYLDAPGLSPKVESGAHDENDDQ